MTLPMISPVALPPVTVGSASTEILAAGAIPQGGQHATLQASELNTEPVYLGYGVDAVLGYGFALHRGQQVEVTPENFFNLAINGISASGGQSVRLTPGAAGLGPFHGVPVDAVSGAVMAIDFPHHEIHEGDTYCACHGLELGAATREYLITAPSSPLQTHLTFAVVASLDLNAWLFEDTTKTGGTAIIPAQRNRNSGNTAQTVLAHTPTGSGDGTLLPSMFIGDPAGPGALAGGGANSDGRHEWILKYGAKYLFRITSASAGCRVTVFLDWYEHTPKA